MVVQLDVVSHPAWVRGLKFTLTYDDNHCPMSHPAWVRGLKYSKLIEKIKIPGVAPCMGAWIEILICNLNSISGISRTLHGCVD